MEKINIWYAGRKSRFAEYLMSEICNAEDLILSKRFNTTKDLFTILEQDSPDILIIDSEQDKTRLLEDISELKELSEKTKIILILKEVDEELINEAVCNGVYDYFLRDVKIQNIEVHFKEIYNSKTPLTSILKNNLKRTFESVNYNIINYDLSPREKEILNLMIGGFTKKKMAEMLSVSFHTIDSHLRKIYHKLGVKTKTQAVSKALKEQLLPAN